MEQRYVIEESVQQRYVGSRDARTFLPFLLPYLRSGLDVLDAGCGVGSIALDLAPTVAPGRIVGIDVDPLQIEVARKWAADRGIENAGFVTASVLQLPFDDATFDVVYANAVLLYVREPVRALAEMRRVLRPGGLAAAVERSPSGGRGPSRHARRTYSTRSSGRDCSSTARRWSSRTGAA